jgi:hypothetical protein
MIIFNERDLQAISQNNEMWRKLGEIVYFTLQVRQEEQISPEMRVNPDKLFPICEDNLERLLKERLP